jgi:hypothetical protein
MRPQPLTALRLGSALLLVLALQACGGGRDTPSPFNRNQAATSIELRVDNQNFNDVRLYLQTVRGRQMVGTVGGNARRTFEVDWRALDDLTVRMEFLAGDDYETNRIDVSPGDRLELTILEIPYNSILRKR